MFKECRTKFEGRWTSWLSHLIFNQVMRGFKSRTPYHVLMLAVAQPVERVTVDHEAASSTLVRQPNLRPDGVVGPTHWTLNPETAGSNPARAANIYGALGELAVPICLSRRGSPVQIRYAPPFDPVAQLVRADAS